MSEAVLRLEGVSRSFGPIRAVDDVSLELKRGEIVTLLGPSGCGKTTTLRIAIGLERSDAGRVMFEDRVVDSKAERIFTPPDKRNMGMVFQSYAIWPHLTVFENVAYPLRVRRMAKAEMRDKVARTLELVGLGGFGDRPSTRLSGGQQQRVAVARGLVFDPTLLLMDEPFSNLDARLRETMRTEIKLLQRRLGITILFVTHDQSEALALSDRIAVMNRGRIEQVGAPMALYAEPRTPAVRDFLGRTVLLPGTLAERAPGRPAVARLDEGPTVEICGADHGDGLAPGGRCVVAIRPEQIVVEPLIGEPPPGELVAHVQALLFLGDRFEAHAALASGRAISLILPPSPGWREDQKLRLRLPRERLQLWPPDPAP